MLNNKRVTLKRNKYVINIFKLFYEGNIIFLIFSDNLG
ncbi:hypothetical protein PPAR_a0677 [Pseudoalteromonas paragorgicola KMM 3548]|nr:hypothetical protein [Pseudoalteromonas distincta KMM 3548]